MISWALRKSLSNGYSFDALKKDLTAGLVVSLVALPLAMALSIAVGLPPQYGLYTAIVAGISVPLLGGSCYQVSGPTAAFVVIIAPIVTHYGMRGLILTTFMAGFVLIVLGLARLGRYINYVPYPVAIGFTSGIALVIAVLSLNDLFGLNIHVLPDSFFQKLSCIIEQLPYIQWPEAFIGLVSLALMFVSPFVFKRTPSPVIGITIGSALALWLDKLGYHIATIGSRFSYTLPNGHQGHGIPPYLPSFHIPGFELSGLFMLPTLAELEFFVVRALVVAALAALESLLSAAVADGMVGSKHNPNAELIGVGFGNILSSLSGGMPATGAIARTTANIHSGGKTPIASALHGLFILLYVAIFAEYISYIPMSSLAALLLLTAYRMSHIEQFMRIIKIGPTEDTIVLFLCFSFTVVIDMVAGVTVGIVAACFLLVKRIAAITQIKTSHKKSYHPKINTKNIPHDVIIYHINGSLFFGNIEQVISQIEVASTQINTFIFDLEEVPFLDSTGLVAIKRIVTDLTNKNKKVIMCANPSITKIIRHKVGAGIISFHETIESALA